MKYFLHDTSSFQDEKITELYINFGYEGLGLFYTLLEKIAYQEKPIKTDILKHQLKVGKRLEKCWIFMEEIGIISSNNGETFNEQLLNFSEKYQIKKEKNAKRISEWRKNQEDTENVTRYEQVCNTPKVKKSKVNEIKEDNIYAWRNDFSVYQRECAEEFTRLSKDEIFLEKLKMYNSGVDIMKSLQKLYDDYWNTEEGWINKKKSKVNKINWATTISNTIKFHKVYYTKQELAEMERR